METVFPCSIAPSERISAGVDGRRVVGEDAEVGELAGPDREVGAATAQVVNVGGRLMGMFDHYRPVPPLRCPACGQPLGGWQGQGGPCLLLAWEQGHASPVEHRVDEDCRISPEALADLRLPDEFEFLADGCACGRLIVATGRCLDGVWSESAVVTADNARPGPMESDREFHARLRDLRRWAGGRP